MPGEAWSVRTYLLYYRGCHSQQVSVSWTNPQTQCDTMCCISQHCARELSSTDVDLGRSPIDFRDLAIHTPTLNSVPPSFGRAGQFKAQSVGDPIPISVGLSLGSANIMSRSRPGIFRAKAGWRFIAIPWFRRLGTEVR